MSGDALKLESDLFKMSLEDEEKAYVPLNVEDEVTYGI